MKLIDYVKRIRTTIPDFIESNKIKNYNSLEERCKIANIICPSLDELKSLGVDFNGVESVEERSTIESSAKKKRVSNKKSSKPKTNDSASTGGSGSKQRVRKSPTKRQRKPNSNKVEPVQPTSGSEGSK